jgi:hypothetical protein
LDFLWASSITKINNNNMVNPVYQQDEELLLNPFGSRYLASGTYTDVNSNEFVVQEDTVIFVLTGGDVSISENSIDYKASMNLSGVTLKKGALIVAPVGEAFKSITIDSGSIMAYNCVVKGEKPGSFVGLLDLYPDASAAYSLRKLRNDYTGDAIRVRIDTTGQPTYEIGFDSNGELDTASLLSFAGSNDAYVHTWYDQSLTGANTVTQVDASKQPKIVNSGSVVTMSGKPAMDTSNLPGSGLYKTNASAVKSANSSSSIFAAYRDSDTAASTGHLFAYGSTDIRLAYLGDGATARARSQVWDINQSAITAEITAPSITAHIVSSIRGQNFSTIFSDGVQGENKTGLQIPSSNTSGTLSAFTFSNGSFSFEGFYSELLFYPSDQSANRTGIESNINDYYTIY